MKNERNRTLIKFAVFVCVLIILTVLLWKSIMTLFSNNEKLKEFILGYGLLAPSILILLVIAQVLFAPIPGQAAGFASGYIFGTFWGTIYSMIGLIIGSYIAFILARKFGRPFVEKVVNKETLQKFDAICAKNGLFTLFLIYLLPALPDDAVCYIAGLTNIRIRNLMI